MNAEHEWWRQQPAAQSVVAVYDALQAHRAHAARDELSTLLWLGWGTRWHAAPAAAPESQGSAGLSSRRTRPAASHSVRRQPPGRATGVGPPHAASLTHQPGEMWGAKRFSGSLLWWAAALAALTLITRIPLRSTQLFAWDSANFALALQHYNVAWHQPQPPGYILYVAAARLVHVVVADANAAYVWLSVVASVGAVWCSVLVGGRLFGAPTGVLGGLVLTTSSLFWGQGVVAYPYAFLALFSSLIVLLALRNRSGGRDTTLVSAALLAIAGGFRPELVPFLLPLWLWGAWRRPRWRWLAGLGLLAVLVAAWYVPMIWLSGGWQTYQSASSGYFLFFLRATSGFGKLLLAVLENTRTLVGYAYNGLMGLALLPLLYIAGRFFAPPRLVSDTCARRSWLYGWRRRSPSTCSSTSATPATCCRSCPHSACSRRTAHSSSPRTPPKRCGSLDRMATMVQTEPEKSWH